MTLLVARADANLADAYRDFANRAGERFASEDNDPATGDGASVWFLGHWGWMHYAAKAHFRKLSVTGPLPEAGDVLIVPVYVDKGHALRRLPKLEVSLVKLD